MYSTLFIGPSLTHLLLHIGMGSRCVAGHVRLLFTKQLCLVQGVITVTNPIFPVQTSVCRAEIKMRNKGIPVSVLPLTQTQHLPLFWRLLKFASFSGVGFSLPGSPMLISCTLALLGGHIWYRFHNTVLLYSWISHILTQAPGLSLLGVQITLFWLLHVLSHLANKPFAKVEAQMTQQSASLWRKKLNLLSQGGCFPHIYEGMWQRRNKRAWGILERPSLALWLVGVCVFPLSFYVCVRLCKKCVSSECLQFGSAVCVNSFKPCRWKPRRLLPGVNARPPFTVTVAV